MRSKPKEGAQDRSPSSFSRYMPSIVSTVILLTAVVVILLNWRDESMKKWAISAAALVAGIWLRKG